MNQESDKESCVVKWADTDKSKYESLVSLKGRSTMTQEVEAIMLEQGTNDSSSSDDNDSNVSLRVSLKRVDHHNRNCNTLTQFLHNNDDKDSKMMEINIDKLQSGNNNTLTQSIVNDSDNDNKWWN